jgi:Fe-Mn family superoxide dismutase
MKNVFEIHNYAQWEPFMNANSVKIHYELHHLQYVRNLEQAGIFHFEDVLQAPEKYTQVDLNNALQVQNHNLFWQSMQINSTKTDVPLQDFKAIANSVFGSGWVWLVQNKHTKEITSLKTSNAECPSDKYIILICLDVWEHAFYHQYPGKRKEFINVFCEHLINHDRIQRLRLK